MQIGPLRKDSFSARWRCLPLALLVSGLAAACSAADGPDGNAAPSAGIAAQPGVPEPVEPDFSGLGCAERNPVPSQGRLLTGVQYDNTIRDLFDGRVVATFAARFPAENQVLGFRTNAEFHRATAWLAEGHQSASEAISAMAAARLPELLPCSVDAAGEACAGAFILDFGTKAFRRPIAADESALLLELYRTGASQLGFDYGIELVIQAVLQSPQFLYRFEFDQSEPMPLAGMVKVATEPAPGEGGGDPAQAIVGGQLDGATPGAGSSVLAYRVVGYEMASRLSYFLWNSMPDAELFEAARLGQLQSREQIETQARRMLDDGKLAATLSDFHGQWLGLDRLSSIVRLVPGVGEVGYGPDWHASVDLFLRQAFLGGGDVASLMSSTTVFLNPRLAALYGVQLPADAAEIDFYPVDFEANRRAGLLTQPGLLALLAHADQSAPIQRGVFMRTELLCQPPPAPPPNIDPTPPDPDPNATTRDRFAQHVAEPACAGCHQLIDPIGLGFENFDHLGRFRDTENGLPVDASGTVAATREVAIQGDFNGALELAQVLGGSEQLRDCIVTQWYRYGSGRVEQEVDLCSMAQARAAFASRGGELKGLLLALATSDAFLYRSDEVLEENTP
jgi:hypothetical protein